MLCDALPVSIICKVRSFGLKNTRRGYERPRSRALSQVTPTFANRVVRSNHSDDREITTGNARSDHRVADTLWSARRQTSRPVLVANSGPCRRQDARQRVCANCQRRFVSTSAAFLGPQSRLSDVCWIAHITWSHRPDATRWRVVIPIQSNLCDIGKLKVGVALERLSAIGLAVEVRPSHVLRGYLASSISAADTRRRTEARDCPRAPRQLRRVWHRKGLAPAQSRRHPGWPGSCPPVDGRAGPGRRGTRQAQADHHDSHRGGYAARRPGRAELQRRGAECSLGRGCDVLQHLERFVYVAFVIDVHSRFIVGWRASWVVAR